MGQPCVFSAKEIGITVYGLLFSTSRHYMVYWFQPLFLMKSILDDASSDNDLNMKRQKMCIN